MSNATAPDPAAGNVDARPVYVVTLAPHRSLSLHGFRLLMAGVALVSLAMGGLFLALGAWPVFGFFGLDAGLIYLALRANFAGARAREHITITASAIEVRRVPARGATRIERLNPFWTRLFREEDEDYGTQQVALVCGPRRIIVGGFLGPQEKALLAMELNAALGAVRRGATPAADQA